MQYIDFDEKEYTVNGRDFLRFKQNKCELEVMWGMNQQRRLLHHLDNSDYYPSRFGQPSEYMKNSLNEQLELIMGRKPKLTVHSFKYHLRSLVDITRF